MFSRRFMLVVASVIYTMTFPCKVNCDISDQEFLDNYDDKISGIACQASKEKLSDMRVNITRYSTREELAKMAFWNFAQNFSDEKAFTSFPGTPKKKRLVELLFKIFSTFCPKEAVPVAYMNIFRVFVMIYLNSADSQDIIDNKWSNITGYLKHCNGKNAIPYNFTYKAMKVIGLSSQLNGMRETADVLAPEEKVDAVFSELDQVIDNLWWVFSHAVGKCYNVFILREKDHPAEFAPMLKALFVHDILKPLMNRWGDPGPLQDFGPIVGNWNIARIQRNIRYCVSAGYFTNGIVDLQLVRPLKVGYVHEGRNSVLNRKTGRTFE